MMRRAALAVIGILAASGALAGFVIAQLLPRQYVSRATVAFASAVPDARVAKAAAQTRSTASLTSFVLQSADYRSELDFTPADEVAERIRQSSSILAAPSGFRVECTDPDRYTALDVMQTLIEQMGRNAGSATKVVGPIRTRLTGMGYGTCVMLGMGVGALIGAAFARVAGRTSRAQIS